MTHSEINGWPLNMKDVHVKGGDLHPQGHCERYLCPYEPSKDNLVPCSVKPSKACSWNPQHLPR